MSEIPSNIITSTHEFGASNGEKLVRFLRGLAKAMDFIRRDKDKAIAIARANGLRGDAAVERKALDYYAEDLDLRLKRDQVAVYLKLLDISEPADKFFDNSFLTRAIGPY